MKTSVNLSNFLPGLKVLFNVVMHLNVTVSRWDRVPIVLITRQVCIKANVCLLDIHFYKSQQPVTYKTSKIMFVTAACNLLMLAVIGYTIRLCEPAILRGKRHVHDSGGTSESTLSSFLYMDPATGKLYNVAAVCNRLLSGYSASGHLYSTGLTMIGRYFDKSIVQRTAVRHDL